jgi:hypothetical protein
MFWMIKKSARTDYTAADSSATLRFRFIANAFIVKLKNHAGPEMWPGKNKHSPQAGPARSFSFCPERTLEEISLHPRARRQPEI